MPCKAAEVSVEWVRDDARLIEVAAGWDRVIGIDTEFQRTDTFFPRPGLYQVSSAGQVWFLDPLALDDLSPFLEILEDRRVTKVLHGCSEDLELLRHHFGAVPVGLFDTQLANAFVSPDFSVGFTRLLAARLGIELQQHETRSDWLARPLTAEQERYAWEDVHYLGPLHADLLADLEATGRLAWFREEMDLRGRFAPSDPDTYYLSIRRASRMDAAALSRLQRLCAWRERQAMAEDRPRGRVVKDDVLVALAFVPMLTAADLQRQLPPGVVRRYGDALLETHRAIATDGDAEHAAATEQPLTGAQQDAVASLRTIANERAQSLGLAPELLSRKREVEACVRHFAIHGELSELYLGWRAPIVGDAFRARLERMR
jgi:ribonuclease D